MELAGPELSVTLVGASETAGLRWTAGATLADRFTVPVKPLRPEIVMVEVEDDPLCIVSVVGAGGEAGFLRGG
jgi:hypothetical protein